MNSSIIFCLNFESRVLAKTARMKSSTLRLAFYPVLHRQERLVHYHSSLSPNRRPLIVQTFFSPELQKWKFLLRQRPLKTGRRPGEITEALLAEATGAIYDGDRRRRRFSCVVMLCWRTTNLNSSGFCDCRTSLVTSKKLLHWQSVLRRGLPYISGDDTFRLRKRSSRCFSQYINHCDRSGRFNCSAFFSNFVAVEPTAWIIWSFFERIPITDFWRTELFWRPGERRWTGREPAEPGLAGRVVYVVGNDSEPLSSIVWFCQARTSRGGFDHRSLRLFPISDTNF